jgi:hypothetical protein
MVCSFGSIGRNKEVCQFVDSANRQFVEIVEVVEIVKVVEVVEIVQIVESARSRLKAAPTGESLFSAFLGNPQSTIRNPQSTSLPFY